MGGLIDQATGGYGQKGLQAQQDAAAESSRVQKQMYDQTRADMTPWRETGVSALGQINSSMGDFNRDFTMQDFQQDPGYAFRMSEGQKAIERSAAARGGLNSGATLKSLDNYSQGLASQEYQGAYDRFNNDRTTRFNRLTTLAGLGQNANTGMAASGANYANQYGQDVMGAANAQAGLAQSNNQMTMGMIGTGAGLYAGSSGWFKGK